MNLRTAGRYVRNGDRTIDGYLNELSVSNWGTGGNLGANGTALAALAQFGASSQDEPPWRDCHWVGSQLAQFGAARLYLVDRLDLLVAQGIIFSAGGPAECAGISQCDQQIVTLPYYFDYPNSSITCLYPSGDQLTIPQLYLVTLALPRQRGALGEDAPEYAVWCESAPTFPTLPANWVNPLEQAGLEEWATYGAYPDTSFGTGLPAGCPDEQYL